MESDGCRHHGYLPLYKSHSKRYAVQHLFLKKIIVKHLNAASSRPWIATGADTTGTVHNSHPKRHASSLHNGGVVCSDADTSEDFFETFCCEYPVCPVFTEADFMAAPHDKV